ncbi:MAG: hypothetical protein ABJF11_08675 [Reichenbachiella sp.]|uniref:type IX secretion system anionic LPS delivery protein PorZ n=1 Tax=Reichenbachiella sp. TaxID=2184521 RepID=UPI003267B201
MKTNLTIVFLVIWIGAKAQELIPIGTWRSHFNYEQTILVEQTQAKIFAATTHGLMIYDLEDRSVSKLSKIDGLSDAGISALAYNDEDDYLAIGYENGNADIISADGISNIPILLNSDIVENKNINHISYYDGQMYWSTDFGMLVINLNGVVEEAYQNLGEEGQTIKTYASAISKDQIFLATTSGVLSGQLTNGDNLQDFNNWERFSGSVVHDSDIITIASDDNFVYVGSNESIYKYDQESWIEISLSLDQNEQVKLIKSEADTIFVLTNQRLFIIDASDNLVEIDIPNEAQINDIIQDSDQILWYADGAEGLIRLEGNSKESIILNGPLNNAASIKVINEDVYAFAELITNTSSSLSNGQGFSVFHEGRWMTSIPTDLLGFENISDAISRNGEFLISSFGQGIANQDTQAVTDYTNSPLEEVSFGSGKTVVSGMDLDDDQNVWIANFSNYSLLKWDGSDDWERFDFGSSAASEPTSLSINANQQVWMTIGSTIGRGVLAFEIESGQSRYITAVSTSLPSDDVNDIAFGKEDEIWIATDRGLAYFPFSFGVIEGQSLDLSVPIFDDTELFEDKEVKALAIDGGNRLWVGTQDGLWLFEENISELVDHFTESNSPLPSNQVIDLAIHPVTGELFVLTDKGMVSYRTQATEATNQHQQVKIFPNPVHPDYDGLVGLTGLASDVSLKVTSIAGRLVRELQATGGGTSWDLVDYNGNRVPTGVYLIFSASADGSETFVGKIAVIN